MCLVTQTFGLLTQYRPASNQYVDDFVKYDIHFKYTELKTYRLTLYNITYEMGTALSLYKNNRTIKNMTQIQILIKLSYMLKVPKFVSLNSYVVLMNAKLILWMN